jgi:hypothetical protein
MSKYKLSPEEIRKKAEAIATNCVRSDGFIKAAMGGILTLLEEATGEKVPEPFDESKVKPWSMWRMDNGEEMILVRGTYSAYEYYFIYACHGETMGKISGRDYPPCSHADAARKIIEKGGEYLGQYDFSAGLPKEAQ